MKYNVGDKVIVRSLEWYNSNKDTHGNVSNEYAHSSWFSKDMKEYCGKIATVVAVKEGYYDSDLDDACFSWEDWMFEDEFVKGIEA